MKITQAVNQWHKILKKGELNLLDDLLTNNVVFHSPILHTPQKGKPLTKMYLTAAYYALFKNAFTYKRQILQDNQAMLEFEAEIDGIIINGVDIIECNESSQISEFIVMVRPLKGLQKVQEKMLQMLEQSKT